MCFGLLSTNIANAQDDFRKKYQTGNGTYVFNDALTIKQDELFTVYKHEFGLGAKDEMRKTLTSVEEDGTFRAKYELFNDGVRVQGSMMNVLGEKGIVERANGFLVTGLKRRRRSLLRNFPSFINVVVSDARRTL